MQANAEPTSPHSPLAAYPPYPQQHKSRAPEIYGFVAWTSTSVLFVLYVLWAVLPDDWIVWLGVEWYPNREWALLLPAYSIVLILLTYFTYWALALSGTPSLDDLRSITDSVGHDPPSEETPYAYVAAASPSSIPVQYDIPIGIVNRILYEPSRSTSKSNAHSSTQSRSPNPDTRDKDCGGTSSKRKGMA